MYWTGATTSASHTFAIVTVSLVYVLYAVHWISWVWVHALKVVSNLPAVLSEQLKKSIIQDMACFLQVDRKNSYAVHVWRVCHVTSDSFNIRNYRLGNRGSKSHASLWFVNKCGRKDNQCETLLCLASNITPASTYVDLRVYNKVQYTRILHERILVTHHDGKFEIRPSK